MIAPPEPETHSVLAKALTILLRLFEQGQESKFSLTPRRIPVERKAPAAKRENDQDMVAKEESVSEAESGWSGVSDNSSTDSECTDVEASSLASDQDRFDTAYDAFRDLANDLYDIDLRRYPM